MYRTASSKTAMEHLKWVVLVGKGSKKFSSTYCRLLGTLLGRIQCPRLERSAEQKIHVLCRSIGKEGFAEMFKEMFASGNLVAISIFVKIINNQEGMEFGALGENGLPTKAQVLELYIKECIMTKSAKTVWFINKTSRNIFPIITEEDCKVTLVPSIQKAMLRSPEITAGVSFGNFVFLNIT
jgi:hypothetical protein